MRGTAVLKAMRDQDREVIFFVFLLNFIWKTITFFLLLQTTRILYEVFFGDFKIKTPSKSEI